MVLGRIWTLSVITQVKCAYGHICTPSWCELKLNYDEFQTL